MHFADRHHHLLDRTDFFYGETVRQKSLIDQLHDAFIVRLKPDRSKMLPAYVHTFWLLPKTILFFFRDTESLGWEPTWTVQQYYSFVTRFTLGFGLAFELPVVVLALVRFGLITYRFMARTRPYAVVLIFILATIITPTPDILTLVAMGLPMCLLYESCIWIAWFMERRRARSAVG